MLRRLLAGAAALIVVAAVGVALFARGIIGGEAVRRALEAQLSARLQQPVTIGSLSASFVPRVAVDLHDVAIGQVPGTTIAEVSVATGLRGLFSRRVEDAEVRISSSRIPVEMAAGIAGAVASGGPSSGSSALTIVSVKALEFRDVDIVAGTQSLKVDLLSSLTGDRMEIRRLTAESSGTRLEATGELSSIAARKGRFTARAGRLNLDELLAIAARLASAASSATPGTPQRGDSSLDLEVALASPGGTLGGFAFDALSTTLQVTAGELGLEPLRFGMFGGSYDGVLRVASSRNGPALELSGRVEGIDVATLLRQTTGSNSLSGTMSGTLALSAQGLATADLLRTARGSGRATIANGAVPGLQMVRSVVLAFGKPSGAPPAGSGSAFTRLEGAFTLADRTLRATDITFASRDFDMTGNAVVRLPEGALEMRANVVLSRDLTAQAGTDLRRYAQEDGRVVVPAVISGTVAAPGVNLDVAAAARRALENEVQRKVRGLLDRFIR
jgi:uncharacterized protein involved in outer membrane biogenesis